MCRLILEARKERARAEVGGKEGWTEEDRMMDMAKPRTKASSRTRQSYKERWRVNGKRHTYLEVHKH